MDEWRWDKNLYRWTYAKNKLNEADFIEFKRELSYSILAGSVEVKSNCLHCFGRGWEGWTETDPVLCRCVKIDHVKMDLQNRGLLTSQKVS